MQKALKPLLLLLGGLAIFSVALSLGVQSLHGRIMQQVADSGLAFDHSPDFERGLLSSKTSGELQIADSLCTGCGVLPYAGEIHQGLGAWLLGDLSLASAKYQVSLPDLGLTPSLPALQLQAQQALSLQAQLQLPESSHSWATRQHHYEMVQAGVDGVFDLSSLQLQIPAIALQRNTKDWLSFENGQVSAQAGDSFSAQAAIGKFSQAAWAWQAEILHLDYSQNGRSESLNADIQAQVQQGQVAGRAHEKTQAQLHARQLHWPATLAFARELPRLLSPKTSGTARMFGLLNLYSLHGPAFFAAHPQLKLNASDLPLPEGLADIALDIRVSENTQRPPMHPAEWQRALQGQIEIIAPPKRLQAWWADMAAFMGYTLALPRSYAALLNRGVVQAQADGRHRLFIDLSA